MRDVKIDETVPAVCMCRRPDKQISHPYAPGCPGFVVRDFLREAMGILYDKSALDPKWEHLHAMMQWHDTEMFKIVHGLEKLKSEILTADPPRV